MGKEELRYSEAEGIMWMNEEEKTICRNISVLVDILLRLCSIKLIIKDEITDCDLVNIYAVEKNVEEARYFLRINNLFI